MRENLVKWFRFCSGAFPQNSVTLPCDTDSPNVKTIIITNEMVSCFIATKQFRQKREKEEEREEEEAQETSTSQF